MVSASRYTSVAISLHWLIAILILAQIAGGLFMVGIPDARASEKFQIYQLHKSFGLTILLLSLVRLAWRFTHKAPPLPAAMAGWEKLAARATHVLFYVLMIGTPLLGWAFVSAAPFDVPTYVFGVIPWPHMPFFDGAADRKALSEGIAELHELAAFSVLGLFVLHVAAALKHHFVNRDDVLARMIPFIRPRS